jgi:hypothetical protein
MQGSAMLLCRGFALHRNVLRAVLLTSSTSYAHAVLAA